MGILSKLSKILGGSEAESVSLDEEFRRFGVDNFLIASRDGLVVYSNIPNGEEVAANSVQLLSMLDSFFGKNEFYGIEISMASWYLIPVEDVIIVLKSKRRVLSVELKEIKEIILKRLEM